MCKQWQSCPVLPTTVLDSSDSLTFSFQSGNPSAVDNRLLFFVVVVFFCESSLGTRLLGEVFVTGIKTESSGQCTFKTQKKSQGMKFK